MVYRCWTVSCKTDGGGACLALDVIGPDEKFKHALLDLSNVFDFQLAQWRLRR